jgi:periplasmic divalent cation tolerance protein
MSFPQEPRLQNVLLVLTNCPDEASAGRIAVHLVAQQLAACVNQLAPMASTYRWHGAIETAVEVPLMIKCTAERYPLVEQAIRELHPYEVPEIIALPLTAGYAPYLRWVVEQTQPPMVA